jgi:uncharacterized membrane protein YbhN (UPF0104 family)
MKRLSPASWRVVRVLGGVVVLSAVVLRLGTGPIIDGLESISVWPLVAAATIAAATTVCAAWRWRLVAERLEVTLPLSTAIAAYYRSQFLNTALPGGVLGDVHRGVSHGRQSGDVARGLRAVAWERLAGQLVQLAVALAVLLLLPSPVRSGSSVVAAGAAVCLVAAALALSVVPERWVRTLLADARQVLPAWPGISVASFLIIVGHTATFVLAARVAGVHASVTTLLPLALLVLLAMVVPLSIGGWGPREGAAAWVFAAAGLGAGRGVATATVYGVMVLVSSLPGAIVLLADRYKGRSSSAPMAENIGLPEPVALLTSGESRVRG